MGKDEGWWGGWLQGYGQWCWGCAKPRWESDVEFHEGCNLCLCCGGGGGGSGVDGSDGGDSVGGRSGSSGVGDSGESIESIFCN